MKIIFLLLTSLICCEISFAARSLPSRYKLTGFQEDTLPKTDVNRSDTFYCRAIETEACIDSIKWHSYISRQINHLTDSIGLTVPPGDYKVQVIFLIERNGSVTNARALNDPGFNFAKLAEQIIQCAPDWEPSTRNGKFTRAYK